MLGGMEKPLPRSFQSDLPEPVSGIGDHFKLSGLLVEQPDFVNFGFFDLTALGNHITDHHFHTYSVPTCLLRGDRLHNAPHVGWTVRLFHNFAGTFRHWYGAQLRILVYTCNLKVVFHIHHFLIRNHKLGTWNEGRHSFDCCLLSCFDKIRHEQRIFIESTIKRPVHTRTSRPKPEQRNEQQQTTDDSDLHPF